MNDASKAPNQSSANTLLTECRDIARSRLAEVIAGALAKIDEDLFQLADKTCKRDEQQVYLDAMTRVRQHRAEIQRQFEENLYWAMVNDLWNSPENWPILKSTVLGCILSKRRPPGK